MTDSFFNLKFNQKQYVNYVLEHGYDITLVHRFFVLRLLYIYAKDELGYSKQQRIDFLKDFIKKHNPVYSEVMINKLIETVLNSRNLSSVSLRDIQNIPIYKREVNFINKNLSSLAHQKIIFTLLCVYKFFAACGFGSGGYLSKDFVSFKNIGQLSNVYNSGKKEIVFKVVLDLCNLGYLRINRDGSFFLNFINKIKYQEDDEVLMTISDYGNFGLYWRLINKDTRITFCQNCGKIFAYRSNLSKGESHIYCRQCAQDIRMSALLRKCIDCGNVFVVGSPSSLTHKCPACRKK